MKKIGDFLKQIREEKKMSIATVSSKLNVKEDYVNFLEKNEIHFFSENRLEQIVIAYNLSKEEEIDFYKIAIYK